MIGNCFLIFISIAVLCVHFGRHDRIKEIEESNRETIEKKKGGKNGISKNKGTGKGKGKV